jgi:hypothetical protein
MSAAEIQPIQRTDRLIFLLAVETLLLSNINSAILPANIQFISYAKQNDYPQ